MAHTNYLVFQPMYRYFKRVAGVGTGNYIYFGKSKGLSDENITAPTTSYPGNKTRVEFKGSCLKQDKITCTHGNIRNIYIVYEISKSFNISSYSTLEDYLFGAVSLTKMLISIKIQDVELDLIDMDLFSS